MSDMTNKLLINMFSLFFIVTVTVAQAGSGQDPVAALDDLDQRIRILERKLELAAEATAEAAANAPVVRADGNGLSIRSRGFSIEFRGLLQADGRWFSGEAVPQSDDSFLLRRLRPTLQGEVGQIAGYRLTPEFAGAQAGIVDAWIDRRFADVVLRAGKQRSPVGLERLQSGASTHFIERGLPTELAPNRDVGIQAQGQLRALFLRWTFGIFNGAVDGADAPPTDTDGLKELALRAFFEPVPGLGFGVAGTHSHRSGGAPRNYATVDRRNGTSFLPGTIYEGDARRISPQGYLYRGPFGLLGEYIESRQTLANVSSGRPPHSVTHRAWQVVGSYVLSGEDSSHLGVRPSQPYRTGSPGWGALEAVARYGQLELDSDSASLGFVAATGVESIENLGVGLNWTLNGNVKVAANYNQTEFSNFSGADREKEKSFFTRLQLAF